MKKRVLIFAGLFLAGILFSQDPYRVYINEFLASNVSIDADIVDFDDYSDWIELYNDEPVEVDLGGYYLTDDLENPVKWMIPPGTTIGAKGFFRFWADGYDDVPGRTYWRSWLGPEAERLYFTTDYYHLNFKLSRAGESIGLFSPGGALVDSVTFRLQHRDVSMGRQPDGSSQWFFFGDPTPEAANNTPAAQDLKVAGSAVLTPESGFYQGSVTVEASGAGTGETIRYTLDGSKPAWNSPELEASVVVMDGTILRTRVFNDTLLPGEISYGTWFIDEEPTLPVISIITPPNALWDDQKGIIENHMKSREIPVHFEYFPSAGNPAIRMDAGLRLSGQASLYYPQVSFTLEARDRYGSDEFGYRVFQQRELDAFKSLYLRNAGVPDHRSTFFRDAMQHTLVLDKMDLDCQAYQPSLVFLNGDYWGIYNIREKINGDYLSTLHDVNPDEIDLLEYETGDDAPIVMEGSTEDYDLLYTYIREHDFSDEENYHHLEQWMDVGEYINYQICEIFFDNMFWPEQNVRMWRERKEGSKWRWILFDTDFGFGMPNMRSTGYTNNTLAYATSSNLSGFQAPPWSTLIFRRLLKNETFSRLFVQRFDAYLNSVFQPDTVLAVINELKLRLTPEMDRHISRWRNGEFYYGDPISSMGEWLGNVAVMEHFARYRPGYQRQHLMDYFDLGGTASLQIRIDPPGAGEVIINEIVHATDSTTGTYFRDVPVALKAVPAVGFRFSGWEGTGADSLNPAEVILAEDSICITARFDSTHASTLPSGIFHDTILTKNASPYYATGDIVVDSGVTLLIEAGVKILMPEKASILVYGRLLVRGTEAEPVVIASNEYSPDWGALCFINASDSSEISYLEITGATRGPDFSRDRAAVSGYHSAFALTNVTIRDSGMPVFTQCGKITLIGCRLSMEKAGDLVNVKKAESALVENCDLRGNDFFDSDAIDYDGVSGGIVRGNRICNFYGFNSDAIDLGEGATGILIENNIIYNINDKGVSVGGGSTAVIRRNVIANCGQGVGIKDFGSYGYMEQNTFYANQYSIASFVKNIGAGGGTADIVNCIIADSRIRSVLVDDLSTANISYSLINTDNPGGLHNILAEPGFINNLHPASTSPAINSGNPDLPADPDGSIPEIGAYPYDDENTVDLRINEIHYHPAGSVNHEFIEILNAGAGETELGGMSISGDISLTFPEGSSLSAGELAVAARDQSVYESRGFQVFQWEEGELKDGPGTVLLRDAGGKVIDFVHYDSRYWWPSEPDGQGPSLELHNPGLENMVSCNWRSSYVDGGTPGLSNNSTTVSGIYINEFLTNNLHINTDEYGEADDWIELYNSTDHTINIGGLYMTDDLGEPFRHQVPFDDAEATTIPAGGYLLLWADGEPGQGTTHLGFRLNHDGEQIGLVQMVDVEAVFIDSLTYGIQTMDVSFGRYPDGSEPWYAMTEPTPGVGNILTTNGRVSETAADRTQLRNYPNPFNGLTTICYFLPDPGLTDLSIYDLSGRKVVTLVNEAQPGGLYELEWNASGQQPGIYICILQSGQGRQVLKMIKTR